MALATLYEALPNTLSTTAPAVRHVDGGLAARASSLIVDMRSLAPLAPGAQEVMVSGQQLYKQRGMKRSAVVVNNAITAAQFKHLAKQSGIYEWERYFDGTHPGCLDAAIAWGRNGVDPDA